MQVALSGHHDILQLMLDYDSGNIDKTDINGRSALCRVMLNFDESEGVDSGAKCTQLLLDYGADATLLDGVAYRREELLYLEKHNSQAKLCESVFKPYGYNALRLHFSCLPGHRYEDLVSRYQQFRKGNKEPLKEWKNIVPMAVYALICQQYERDQKGQKLDVKNQKYEHNESDSEDLYGGVYPPDVLMQLCHLQQFRIDGHCAAVFKQDIWDGLERELNKKPPKRLSVKDRLK